MAVEMCQLAELTEKRVRIIEGPQAQADSVNAVDR